MITEDYVSSEIAKLLKEKGFDEPTLYYYIAGHLLQHYSLLSNGDTAGISAPTIQTAMKWLREIHNINIDIVSIWNKIRWEYQIIIITPKTAAKPYIHKTIYIKREQACEVAIKYCLENLI